MFAFPSVKEGFGLVALEALAAELPVVASDLDVLRGFLTDGESALLVAGRRRRGARRRRSRGSARDGALRDAAARRRPGVVAAHTWDAAAAAHERAYESFLLAEVR